jgi:hypothetical protein
LSTFSASFFDHSVHGLSFFWADATPSASDIVNAARQINTTFFMAAPFLLEKNPFWGGNRRLRVQKDSANQIR